MHQPFEAKALTAAAGDSTAPVRPIKHNNDVVMHIYTQGHDIFITKQQAMEFFGLVDLSTNESLRRAYEQILTTPYGAKPVAMPQPEEIVAKPAVIDWDILYLEDEFSVAVMHGQFEGATRQQAIQAFRAGLGPVPYIVGCTQRDLDLDQ